MTGQRPTGKGVRGRNLVPFTLFPLPFRLPHAAYFELLHLPPIAMVLLATTAFTTVAADGWPPPSRLIPFLCAILLTQLAISVHNDYCDRELDAKAKPWRAIPAGLISAAAVLRLSVLLLGLGLLVAALLGPLVAALVAICTVAGLIYNAWLKRSAWTWLPFWIALPSLVVAAFAVVGRFEPWLWLVYLIGGPLVLAIYLADTLADIETDTALGVRGLAQRLGPVPARFTCWGAVALALALALSLRSPTTVPGPFYLLAGGALVAAVPLGFPRVRRTHWLAIMVSAIALSTGWLIDMTV